MMRRYIPWAWRDL